MKLFARPLIPLIHYTPLSHIEPEFGRISDMTNVY